MDPASSERSRFREALADVPQKPSRGHCGDGFLHRANAHVRCSALLFRHRPRPAEDPAFQCDAKSQRTLGCTATARSMGLQTAAQILTIRPRRKVWSRGVFGCEGFGERQPCVTPPAAGCSQHPGGRHHNFSKLLQIKGYEVFRVDRLRLIAHFVFPFRVCSARAAGIQIERSCTELRNQQGAAEHGDALHEHDRPNRRLRGAPLYPKPVSHSSPILAFL